MRVLAFLLCFWLAWASPSPAEPTFGTEFTFTESALWSDFSKNGRGTDFQKTYLKKMADIYRGKCGGWGCTVTETKDKYGVLSYRIEYPKGEVPGYYFDVTLDNAVVEIITSPLTRSQTAKIAKNMQTQIFEVAKEVKLTPHEYAGQGHVHIGLESAFGDDAMLLRNFVVDFFNHPELGNGILIDRTDTLNSRQLADLSQETKDAFRKVIIDFDRAHREGAAWTIHEFLDKMLDDVYFPAEKRGDIEKSRYVALNFLSGVYGEKGKRTIEVRSLRPTRDSKSHLLILEMLEKRIGWLKERTTPIKVELPKLSSEVDLANSWKTYLTEMGGDVAHFAPIVPSSSPCFAQFKQLR